MKFSPDWTLKIFMLGVGCGRKKFFQKFLQKVNLWARFIHEQGFEPQIGVHGQVHDEKHPFHLCVRWVACIRVVICHLERNFFYFIVTISVKYLPSYHCLVQFSGDGGCGHLRFVWPKVLPHDEFDVFQSCLWKFYKTTFVKAKKKNTPCGSFPQ